MSSSTSRWAAARREVDELTRQKDSIASHLAQVRQLLGGQLPGGVDPAMSAAQAKPAIAADPALSAPGAAPRNGAGQAAPTTVQPATQVSAAPTQVQAQRPAPANGGAATQANGKQGPSGKEDEEDWWTE